MKKILLLENDLQVAEALRMHLEKHDYDMLLATTLDEAKKSIAYSSPDALVVDLGMATPELLDFYQWLVEQPQLRSIPRIFMEGNETPVIRELKMRSHDLFLQKPIQLPEFFQVLGTLVGESEEEEEEISESDRMLRSFVGQQIGSAIMKREIGRGGMGAVFEGYQESLDRKVAIKVMLPDLIKDPAAAGRFRREALAIARLKSPHIVQVFDAGLTDDGVFYIVMEFLDGGTLDDHLERKKKLTVSESVNIIGQVAQGLFSAHEAGLIHRDIKPSNLILAPSGHVTITDFGLVRHGEDMRFTQTGIVVGTPHYLSPEQAYGRQIDHRSDIYSLGIVFYELLTGELPFDSNNLTQVLLAHVQQPLPDPRKVVPDIPEAVVKILMSMSEKDPNERVQDCRELFLALDALGYQARFQTGQERVLSYHGHITGHHASANTSMMDAVTSRPQNGNISLNSSMAQRLSSLKNVSLTQFNQDNLLGTVWLSGSGSILEEKGSFTPEWSNALVMLIGHAQQIEAATGLGEWQHTLFESDKQVMTIFPKDEHTCAMLFGQTMAQNSMNLSAYSMGSSQGTQSGISPLEQVLSIAGVEHALLFDEVGQLIDHASQQPLDASHYEIRLLPIVHILQSLPISCAGIDCWFEHGRTMIWPVGNRTLFVTSGARVNKSMISIIIGRQLGLLSGGTANVPAQPMRNVTPTHSASLHVSSARQTPSTNRLSSPVVATDGACFSSDDISVLGKEYAKFIGPIAKAALNKQIKKMGYTKHTLPIQLQKTLLNALAERLEESKRGVFIKNAEGLLDKLATKK
tara:strand:+ start:24697 stop:27105 length:2409 start_codon:yes stop_codon:yes gene_type:complete